jgi:tetratricopeptide (TPR) repeat protein
MGEVYKAIDHASSRTVAVKVLSERADSARFEREAKVLASLDHPSIVRYFGHGTAEDGSRWLAMEWLEGEDLANRIAREGLSVRDALGVFERVASALAVAHDRGVVHRDIKPSNIYLVGGSPSDARLIDFGIARRTGGDTQLLTRTGAIMGTPSYMAPEQASGRSTVDHRADLYALGAVLFHAVAGVAPFVADNVMALLAKVLLEDAPRLRELRPEVDPALDELVASLLDKQPERRPSSARELVRRAGALRAAVAELSAPAGDDTNGRHTSAISTGEQRVHCVVLAVESTHQAAARSISVELPSTAEAFTVAQHAEAPMDLVLRSLRARLLGADVRVERIGEGALLCVLTGASTEKAVRAARIAIELRERLPHVRIVIATGHASVTGNSPLGTVLERAALFVNDPHADDEIAVDATTATLIAERFELRATGDRAVLVRERHDNEDARVSLLLGKKSPCVGRERELGLLRATFDEVVADSTARAVVVTGAPGSGKSRVRTEFLRSISQYEDPPTLWRARCEPTAIDAPLSMIGALVRAALIGPTITAVDEQRSLLKANVEQCLGEGHRRTTAFLGELAGACFDDSFDSALAAARNDPPTMAALSLEAFSTLVHGSAARAPLVIAIEDAQWADDASLRMIDAVLRERCDEPWMVTLFARPELIERAPKLWAERGAIELRLAPLSRRACERLAQAALGPSVEPLAIARIVERSEGNPFYLEELVRALAAGGDDVPDSVLAMVQARLDGLPSIARQTLRAAAVFGEHFWTGAVSTLVGEPRALVGQRLDELRANEIVTLCTESRFTGEREYRFQHGLVRDAAYTMLTEQDRALGHKLAAEWLTAAGEREPLVLAEHWERGGERTRAIECVLIEIDRAVAAADADAIDALSRRAERLAAERGAVEQSLRARLTRVRAESLHARRDLRGAIDAAREALDLATPDQLDWARAAVQVAVLGARMGEQALLDSLERAVVVREGQHALVDRVRALLARTAYITDEVERGDALMAAMAFDAAELDAFRATDATTGALAYGALVHRNRGESQLWRRLDFAERALAMAISAGDRVVEAYAWTTLATMQADLGHTDDCARVVEHELRARPDRMSLPAMTATTMVLEARVALARGAIDEATGAMQTAIEFYRFTGDRRRVTYTQVLLCEALLCAGDSAAGGLFAEVDAVIDELPMMRPWFDVTRGRWLLMRGEAREAVALARRAVANPRRTLFFQSEIGAPLLLAAAHEALGEQERARLIRAELARATRERLATIPTEVRDKSLRGLAVLREALG